MLSRTREMAFVLFFLKTVLSYNGISSDIIYRQTSTFA